MDCLTHTTKICINGIRKYPNCRYGYLVHGGYTFLIIETCLKMVTKHTVFLVNDVLIDDDLIDCNKICDNYEAGKHDLIVVSKRQPEDYCWLDNINKIHGSAPGAMKRLVTIALRIIKRVFGPVEVRIMDDSKINDIKTSFPFALETGNSIYNKYARTKYIDYAGYELHDFGLLDLIRNVVIPSDDAVINGMTIGSLCKTFFRNPIDYQKHLETIILGNPVLTLPFSKTECIRLYDEIIGDKISFCDLYDNINAQYRYLSISAGTY